MGGLDFEVRDWAAWAPGRETRAAWQTWAGGPAETGERREAAPPGIPMMLRRRIAPLGQKLAQAALAVSPSATPFRYVLATRHGELSRTVSILEAAAANDPVSPADFSVSVHHALIGLLSIHTANRGGHTAVSAGRDSFAAGMLEAATLIAERPEEPVLLLLADEPLPADYQAFRETDDITTPMALALLLGAASGGQAIGFSAEPKRAAAPPAVSPALDFLHFFLSNAPAAVSEGVRMTWRWQRAA